VLDFGIARLREANAPSSATQTGVTMGTPAFMPPEQALARSREIDGQTDLWAVGATMFTLISGQFVHPAESATEMLVRAASERARSLASVAPQVPAPIAAVIDRALAFAKAERWADARAMAEALAQAHQAAYGQDTGPRRSSSRPPVPGLALVAAAQAAARTDAVRGRVETLVAPGSSALGFPSRTTTSALSRPATEAAPGAAPRPRPSRRGAVVALGALTLVAVAVAVAVAGSRLLGPHLASKAAPPESEEARGAIDSRSPVAVNAHNEAPASVLVGLPAEAARTVPYADAALPVDAAGVIGNASEPQGRAAATTPSPVALTAPSTGKPAVTGPDPTRLGRGRAGAPAAGNAGNAGNKGRAAGAASVDPLSMPIQ
jgi:hypothetical protein